MSTTRLTGWRKIANALWDAPSDPQIYGALELDATPALGFIARARDQGDQGGHVTATHLVGRAVAHALVAVPDLNVRLVGDRAVSRKSIDVFFITMVAKGRDLTGVKVAHVDRKSVLDVAKELRERSQRMKSGDDPDFARVKRTMDALPRPLLRLALRVSAWVAGDHDKSIPLLGVAASPFGSAMVSSVGMLGLPMGFSPLAWMYRVPLLVLVGEITEKPVAVSGRVEVRPILPITVTIDHRYVDGAQLGEALRAFRKYLSNPASFEPARTAENVRPAVQPPSQPPPAFGGR
jgi:pyruvate/2-oxoglutarate dehydrogenase complex dihydrolipoamide acyltransferase (E2) component